MGFLIQNEGHKDSETQGILWRGAVGGGAHLSISRPTTVKVNENYSNQEKADE